MTHQGTVEALNCIGLGASLLLQHMDFRMASSDYLLTNARVCLVVILFVGEVLSDLGNFAFVALHLFFAGRRYGAAVAELLRIIEMLKEIHTKAKDIITPLYLATSLLYNVSRRWSL